MKFVVLASAGCYLFGGLNRFVFGAAVILQLGYLVVRGIMVGRLPLVGPHDTLLLFSASIGLAGIIFLKAKELAGSTPFRFASSLLAGLTCLAALPLPVLNFPLPPILNTFWFEIHVLLAFFAYALFAVGAILGVMYLRDQAKGLLDLQYRAALVGYTFFSASMISGGIWGYFAWGTYWLWTPKELWTSVLWLFYTLYLHIRFKGTQWEKVLAWLGVVGFAVTLFTYLGVSLLMNSSHSF